MTTENLTNNATTTLRVNCGPEDTAIYVAISTGFPAPNFRVAVDGEILLVTAIDGTTWTVARGQETDNGGSLARGHSAGATVAAVLTVAGLTNYVRGLMSPIYCGPIS